MRLSSIGKSLRMDRIFGEDHRTVVIVMDYGGFQGPAPEWEDPAPKIEAVVEGGADAIMITFGLAERYSKLAKGKSSVILSVPLPDEGMEETVRLALKAGVDALKTFLILGTADEPRVLGNHW